MQYSSSKFLAATGLITCVSAHGFITSPTARLAGSAMEAACGTQVYNNQASDNYGNIQGELQVAASQSDYNAAECDIWLCKGYKFADNSAANVQSWTAGQVVDFTFDIRAPHTGYANVSIINTATNTVIGDALATYDVFASNSVSTVANQTSFSVTIPSDLGNTCSVAGACVVQHFWNAESINQTYESCVDFTVGGSSSSSASVSSSPSSAAISSSTATASSVSSASATTVTAAATSALSPNITSSSIVPTTMQTQTSAKSSVTKSSAAAAATVASDDDDDDC